MEEHYKVVFFLVCSYDAVRTLYVGARLSCGRDNLWVN